MCYQQNYKGHISDYKGILLSEMYLQQLKKWK